MTDWTGQEAISTTWTPEELTEFLNGDFEDLTDDWPDHWTAMNDTGQVGSQRGYVTLEV